MRKSIYNDRSFTLPCSIWSTASRRSVDWVDMVHAHPTSRRSFAKNDSLIYYVLRACSFPVVVLGAKHLLLSRVQQPVEHLKAVNALRQAQLCATVGLHGRRSSSLITDSLSALNVFWRVGLTKSNSSNLSSLSMSVEIRNVETYRPMLTCYKKSELMLMRRARAYSSFCLDVILIYPHSFRCNSLLSSQKSPKNY